MSKLNDIITVPCLPVLGPVHPLEVNEDLLFAITDSSARNELLPYDKALRWGSIPTELVVPGGITVDGDNSVTVTTMQNGKTRRYIYGDSQADIMDDCDEIVTFSANYRATEAHEVSSAVFIDYFAHIDNVQPDECIHFLHDLPGDSREGLKSLGDDPSVRGLEVAYDMDMANPGKFPTLAYIQDGVVLGAIGPLNILADSRGVNRLLPCYFLVQPQYRKKGIGAMLWSAMRVWARDNGANYKVLQAEAGSAAEKFYHSQGLECLGYVYRKRRVWVKL